MTALRWYPTAAVALATVLAACRFQPSTVVLAGTPGDIAALVGDWSGEYWSAESGRTGSLLFTIAAGTDTALGDVMMTPTRGEPVFAADARSGEHREHSDAPHMLRAHFVTVDGDIIRGELEPYIAPDCNCVVTTVFRGVLRGDRIEGQYVTRGQGGLEQEGRWFMTRRRT